MQNNMSRVDLHVHTCYSQDAGDWLLHQLGANECYTTPQEVYNLALARGMDFVTITDHDTIDGALELAHHDNFFISEEITTLFPEDGTRLHVIALNITEEHHRLIQALKFNIYELVNYFHAENLVHFVAHPFFRMGERLTIEHFEKMLLLFEAFEVKNGGKQLWPDNLLEQILTSLSPGRIWQLADKHNIRPRGDFPWRKSMVAGSDDHGGILIGCPHTACPKAESVEQLLSFIRMGECRAAGHGGTTLNVAHSIFAVSYKHFKTNKASLDLGKSEIVWNLLGQLFDGANTQRNLSYTAKMALFANEHFNLFQIGKASASALHFLKTQFIELLRSDKDLRYFLRNGLDFDHGNNDRMFAIINKMTNRVITQTVGRADGKLPANPKDIFAQLKIIISLFPLLAPYFIACKTEYRDRPLMRRAYKKFCAGRNGNASERIAVFVDGRIKAGAVKRVLQEEMSRGAEIVFFGLSSNRNNSEVIKNFSPITTVKFPLITSSPLPIPPFLEIANTLAKNDFTKIYLHTIGPMSMCGALLGKWMRIPLIGRYPYPGLKKLFATYQDRNHQKVLDKVVQFFFSMLSEVRVITAFVKREAEALGVAAEKIRMLRNSSPALWKNHRITSRAGRWRHQSQRGEKELA